MSLSTRWAGAWPPLLAVTVVTAVGAPAAVASYRHARDVVDSVGDPVMAPWLPLSVDGMLVAAMVVIWVRRHRGQPAGRGPWAALWFGMVVTVCANLAAATEASVKAYAVALFPPLALAITLELVALVAGRTASPLLSGLAIVNQPERPVDPRHAGEDDAAESDLVAPVHVAGQATQLSATGAAGSHADGTRPEEPAPADPSVVEPMVVEPVEQQVDADPGQPRAGAAGVRVDRQVGPNSMLERVRELADRNGGRPSRNAVMRELSIGVKKAAALLEEFDQTGPNRVVTTGTRRSA